MNSDVHFKEAYTHIIFEGYQEAVVGRRVGDVCSRVDSELEGLDITDGILDRRIDVAGVIPRSIAAKE